VRISYARSSVTDPTRLAIATAMDTMPMAKPTLRKRISLLTSCHKFMGSSLVQFFVELVQTLEEVLRPGAAWHGQPRPPFDLGVPIDGQQQIDPRVIFLDLARAGANQELAGRGNRA